MSDLKAYQMLIDGVWCDADDGQTFESFNPATGEAWATAPVAGESDVNRAVEAAQRAFSEGPWSKMRPTQRGKLLRKLADLLAERSEELGRCETIDTGKMFKETRLAGGLHRRLLPLLRGSCRQGARRHLSHRQA